MNRRDKFLVAISIAILIFGSIAAVTVIDLAHQVTGILGTTNGGTGLNNSVGTSGQALVSNGTTGFAPGVPTISLALGSSGTVTSGKLACATASNTMGNCTALPPANVLGVFNSSSTYLTVGITSVTLDATVNVVFGDFLCTSSTSAGAAHDNGTIPCTTGQYVGIVTTTATSVSSATTSLRLQ